MVVIRLILTGKFFINPKPNIFDNLDSITISDDFSNFISTIKYFLPFHSSSV